jgi:hypothetical protein
MKNNLNEFTFKPKEIKTKEMSMDEFISYLMVCRNVLHAMHLKVTGMGSDATHRALQEGYEGILEASDAIAEIYQGYYGTLLNLKFETGNEYLSYKPVDYVKEILQHVEKCKMKYQNNSMLLNEIDVLVALLAKVHYKLKFLS